MRKKTILCLAALALLATAVGCSKAKTCRCSVRGTSHVRIVKIDKGECTSLKVFAGHDALDSIWADSLLCTDYEFHIDSIFEEK